MVVAEVVLRLVVEVVVLLLLTEVVVLLLLGEAAILLHLVEEEVGFPPGEERSFQEEVKGVVLLLTVVVAAGFVVSRGYPLLVAGRISLVPTRLG